jgi:hypothetical protein
MTLSRDQILEASDLRSQLAEVPEWGGAVLVRTMTGADRDAFENSMVSVKPDGTREQNLTNFRTKLVALTVVDDAGNLLFSADDLARLAAKSALAIDRVFVVAQSINGLGAQAVETAAKN